MATNAWGDGYGRAGGVGQNNYFQANPDVGQAYAASGGGGMSPEEYALWHYDNYGQYEGRQGVLPTGQNTFERMQGANAGTFYDQYAVGQQQEGPGGYYALSPNPTKGVGNQSLAQYQQGFGDWYNKSAGGLRGWAGGPSGTAGGTMGGTTSKPNTGSTTQTNPNGALVDALRQKPNRYQGLGMGLGTGATLPQTKTADLTKLGQSNTPSGLFQSV